VGGTVARGDQGRVAGHVHLRIELLLVYLVLAAQYESWVLPIIILLAVPLAVFGALSAQMLSGLHQ
jgi:multidrug efflux pump subunit AcrB